DNDKKKIQDDASKAASGGEGPPAALERMKPSTDEGQLFSPDAWLERRRRRRRLLAAFFGALLLSALGLLGGAIAIAVGHRRALDDAQTLVASAESQPPGAQARIFSQARARHAAARGFGVGEQRWLALEARIVMCEARATAQAALDAGDPSTAQAVIQAALQKIPAEDDDDRGFLNALLLRADKDALIVQGRRAEEARNWAVAFQSFTNANAEPHLSRVRKEMQDELQAL